MSTVDHIMIIAWHGDFSRAAILVLPACERCGFMGIFCVFVSPGPSYIIQYDVSVVWKVS